MAASDQLLVVIDPVARRSDGESVRIAKDVLSAGAATKICLPDGPEEFARALARRGSRRPVVIGDDRALASAVALLHRERELASAVLSLVPVGTSLSLAEALGVPTGTVAAARAVLEGVERRLDLLVDDRDGVVLGNLRIPPVGGEPGASGDGETGTGSGSGSGSEGFGWSGWSGRFGGSGGFVGLGRSGAPGSPGCRAEGSTGSRGSTGPGSPGFGGVGKSDGCGAEGFGPGETGESSLSGSGRSPAAGESDGAAGSGGAGASGGAGSAGGGLAAAGHAGHWLLSTCQSLVRTLTVRPPKAVPVQRTAAPARLRIEVDGVTLIDLDQPVEAVSVTPGTAGRARILVRPSSVGAEAAPLHAVGRSITVSGADFRYRADAMVTGPVRTRTWTVLPRAWALTLPA
ncbi:diacylglycerol kinase [Streptomyces sp. PSKA54]|uniref:Diacylglycerol kinase n=1 Tax=Streptomyces himalayensis subsp. aureolus TaxID=2758039 RepID=A0A7W2HJZ8_9ACTN|nr:diacylglycerol kinase [Streptomyces himalayensis]MBA4866655.1 diacylglycerol kinase [Streptomyces himalayensis subsp. aureolus]